MAEGIRGVKLRELNKGHGSKFCVGSRLRKVTPEEGWKTHRPKRCDYNNKHEDNSPKTLNYNIYIFIAELPNSSLIFFAQVSLFS